VHGDIPITRSATAAENRAVTFPHATASVDGASTSDPFFTHARMQGANANHLKTAKRQRIDVQAEGAFQALGSGVTVQQILTPCCAIVPDLHLTTFDVQRRSGVEFPFGFSVE
jgi:hypothetical protein